MMFLTAPIQPAAQRPRDLVVPCHHHLVASQTNHRIFTTAVSQSRNTSRPTTNLRLLPKMPLIASSTRRSRLVLRRVISFSPRVSPIFVAHLNSPLFCIVPASARAGHFSSALEPMFQLYFTFFCVYQVDVLTRLSRSLWPREACQEGSCS